MKELWICSICGMSMPCMRKGKLYDEHLQQFSLSIGLKFCTVCGDTWFSGARRISVTCLRYVLQMWKVCATHCPSLSQFVHICPSLSRLYRFRTFKPDALVVHWKVITDISHTYATYKPAISQPQARSITEVLQRQARSITAALQPQARTMLKTHVLEPLGQVRIGYFFSSSQQPLWILNNEQMNFECWSWHNQQSWISN